MIAVIEEHRQVHGVEPICRACPGPDPGVLPIAPSTWYARQAVRHDPGRASARARRDAGLKEKIRRVFEDNYRVYGARKSLPPPAR